MPDSLANHFGNAPPFLRPPSSFPVCHLTQIGTVHHGRIVKPIYTKKFFVWEGMRLRAFLGNILSLMRKLEQQTGKMYYLHA